ncbi:YwqG family protein [Stakelama tenebrarum]|uniref:DUF1963 domain-containing protein n=1 Tax=Stakelama tenebrarum TaxID=2711215 RepID=A0A6G6Y789_9SPHN|nr:DUF1963 domain-containing protein [Sphingosinithalassobacter tenebrarum]QIG80443.1 DUF1963 domain-containing protein [Sphingosinithalassobacter tenebrarum]
MSPWVGLAVFVLGWGGIFWWWRRSRRRPDPFPGASAIDVWRADFERENPVSTPFTDGEISDFLAWSETLKLPAIRLTPVERPVRAGGTRIGGPAWLAECEEWPRDSSGTPLEFLAQLDFGDLPQLPDFPDAGLLQFFIGRDDMFGVDHETPERGKAKLIWRPVLPGNGALLSPPPIAGDECLSDFTPYHDEVVRAIGMTLSGQIRESWPESHDWRIRERLEGQLRRPGIDRIEDMLVAEARLPDLAHHVGGNTAFVQGDFRTAGRFADYRVLLRLSSETGLMWGDVGEAAFLISQRDLLARRFDRVIFYWDCG